MQCGDVHSIWKPKCFYRFQYSLKYETLGRHAHAQEVKNTQWAALINHAPRNLKMIMKQNLDTCTQMYVHVHVGDVAV